MRRGQFRLGWNAQSETRMPKEVDFLTTLTSWMPSSSTLTGIKHWEQTGLDQAHQGGDPGTYHSPKRSSQGAHSYPKTNYNQAPQRTKVNMWHLHFEDSMRTEMSLIKSVTYTLSAITTPIISCVSDRDGEDLDSQGEGSSQPDTISLASRTSQNTLDSDKVRTCAHLWPETA